MITRSKQSVLQPRNVIEHQYTNHGDDRNGQRRVKQAVTQTRRALFPLLAGALMITAQLDAAKTGDQRHDHHRDADGNVDCTFVAHQLIRPVAQQEQQPVDAPE